MNAKRNNNNSDAWIFRRILLERMDLNVFPIVENKGITDSRLLENLDLFRERNADRNGDTRILATCAGGTGSYIIR